MRKLIAAIVVTLACSTGALAQTYPSRPVTLIVPYPAGGPSDTLARVLTERLRVTLGQTIIIENVSGAGGAIGTARVARSAPDGYTLGLGHIQTHVLNSATQNLGYDVVKDFDPVALIADTPQWLAVRASLPAKDVKEFIAWLKANKATAGTVGVGGPPDIASVMFQQKTGTSFQLVPYRGGAPLIQDLLGGQIDFTFGQAANYLGPVRSGKLRALAVLSKERWWAAPDVPTLDEAGVAGLHISFWHGLWVPHGTPKDIIATIHGAVVKALADPGLKQRFRDIGQQLWPVEQQTPEALAAFQQGEIARWGPIVKAANIKSE